MCEYHVAQSRFYGQRARLITRIAVLGHRLEAALEAFAKLKQPPLRPRRKRA
jgi:hypothetical protein